MVKNKLTKKEVLLNDEYQEFIAKKLIVIAPSGFDVPAEELNPLLFDWQQDIVSWALRRGKSALFEDCGLGKTPQQLEWAHRVHLHTGKPVLIFAPLAVSEQTARLEAPKFGYAVQICATQDDVVNGINITNYEKLHHFSPEGWGGVILDESSILKGYDGKTRQLLNEFCADIPYKLSCTATPAPNDLDELTRQAEWLGIMRENEIKAVFFTQDGNTTTKWRLKRHAEEEFWKWMGQWSVALRKPSDLGYDDNGFTLPEIEYIPIVVKGEVADGYLVPVDAQTMTERRAARRASLGTRVQEAAGLADESDDAWVFWCDLNSESEALAKSIDGAVEIAGRHSEAYKKDAMIGFTEGRYLRLVSKPSICGWGMNWQHCHNVAFVGLSDSYEAFYQAIRRFWRYGQKNVVKCYIITSETEGAVVSNIRRKELQSAKMFDEIVKHMAVYSEVGKRAVRDEMTYEEDVRHGKDWTAYLGDSVNTIDNLDDNSIGLSIYSPPFPTMYTYTNSVHDMGNVKDIREMIEQFAFLSKKLLQKTMPGRHTCVHLTQTTAQKGRDGYIGLKDFRGETIRMMEECGWHYYGEVCIDKNPQVKAIRTKDRGLLFKSLAKDSANMHMAMADYLLQFRKPGDNATPIAAGISTRYHNTDGWITADEWIRWARPVWYSADWVPDTEIVLLRDSDDPNSFTVTYNDGKNSWDGIKETDVLNVRQARETNDERHLAPLQLGVIERAIKLWSNPGDLVYSPFLGIGSEGYMAVKLGRKFVGCELKKSYWESACRNLESAEREQGHNLLDLMNWG